MALNVRPPRARPDWWPQAIAATTVILAVGLGLPSARHPAGVIVTLALVLAAGAVFVYLLGARVGLVGLLIATCLLDRFTFSASAVDIRAEQVASLLGLAVVAGMALTAPGGLSLLRPNRIEVLLGLWFLVSLISSIFFAPAVAHSLKGVGLLVVSSLGLLLPRRLVDAKTAAVEMPLIVSILLIALAAEAAYGMAAWLIHLFGPTVGISANGATGHFSAYGTLWEPNVFGAICAAGVAAWTWLGPRYFRFAWIGISLCLGGTVVSFTRAAWVAALLIIVLAFFGPLRMRAARRQFALGALGAVVLTVLIVGAERSGAYYLPPKPSAASGPAPAHAPAHAIPNLLANEVDVLGRLDQVGIAWPDVKSHLLLGNGTATYDVRHVYKGGAEHIANLELSVLYDTGILGLLIFLAFLAAVALKAWKHRRDPIVAGLGMTTLVIAITNQATETTELMITWLLLGLLLMGIATTAARPVLTQQARPRAGPQA